VVIFANLLKNLVYPLEIIKMVHWIHGYVFDVAIRKKRDELKKRNILNLKRRF